jgi:hypothetical protein
VHEAVDEVSSATLERERGSDPYLSEERFQPVRPTAVQSAGAASYAQTLKNATGKIDLTQLPVPDSDLRLRLADRLRSPDHPELLRLSASHIDAFIACPFGYLLGHVLRLDELTLAAEPDDARELGQLYHEIIARFYGELADAGAPFRAAARAEYHDRIEELADERYRKRRGMIPDIVYRANRETFSRVAQRLLEHDAVLIDGHTPLLVEAERETAELTPGVLIVARIDRATQAPDDTLLLVDYKKSRLPDKKQINAGSSEPTGGAPGEVDLLGSVQMPLYVALLEAEGERVAGAGFYSLERGEYRALFGSTGGDGRPSMVRERMDEIVELTTSLVHDIAGRINRGDFTCGARCDGCPMQGICRTGYAVQ